MHVKVVPVSLTSHLHNPGHLICALCLEGPAGGHGGDGGLAACGICHTPVSVASCRRVFLANSASTDRSDVALQERLASFVPDLSLRLPRLTPCRDADIVRISQQAQTALRRLGVYQLRLRLLLTEHSLNQAVDDGLRQQIMVLLPSYQRARELSVTLRTDLQRLRTRSAALRSVRVSLCLGEPSHLIMHEGASSGCPWCG